MDIDRVRYFNVFAETGSLVRASEIVGISQPALSKALKVLERDVGLKLVESDGRGLRLTQQGRTFQKKTQPLLAEWLDIPNSVRASYDSKPFRIASFEVFTTYFLSRVLEFTKLNGMEVLELGPGQMEKAVADDRADLAITYAPVPLAGIEFVEITKIRMEVFGLDSFSGESFDQLPFAVPILPFEGMPSKVMGLDGWPEHRFQRNAQFKVTMMESALELCRSGHAVGYFPDFVIKLHNYKMIKRFHLKQLKCPVLIKDRLQSVYLIRRQGQPETPIERQIAKTIRSLL